MRPSTTCVAENIIILFVNCLVRFGSFATPFEWSDIFRPTIMCALWRVDATPDSIQCPASGFIRKGFIPTEVESLRLQDNMQTGTTAPWPTATLMYCGKFRPKRFQADITLCWDPQLRPKMVNVSRSVDPE